MTVSCLHTKKIYNGNGVGREWDITFPFCSPDDLQFYLVDETGAQTPLYANLFIDTARKVLVYPTPESELPPLPAGKKIVLSRQTPLTQENAFSAQQAFDPLVLEHGCDKAVMICQELAEEMARTVKFPISKEDGETDALQYMSLLEQALQNAVAANSTAQQSITQADRTAQTATQAAADAQTAVEALRTHVAQAQESKTAAQNAQTAAQQAKTAAEAAKTQAQAAQTAAQSAAAAAAASEQGASSSAAAALNSQNAAAASQKAAASSASTAQTQAQNAAQSAQNAAASAAEAQAYGILPAGMIISGVMISAPTGFLLCNGAAVSRTQYAALYAVIGTNFGAGDGASTFNVPDYRGCFLRGQGGDSGTLYQKQPMGAPDAAGTFNSGWQTDDLLAGAFYNTGRSGTASPDGAKWWGAQVGMVLSRSNSVYGAAAEIRPVNFAVNYFIKY